VVKHTIRATVGDVLGWDQKRCSVLLISGEEPLVAELRMMRCKEVVVTVETAERPGQKELF
jgi:hypothetical protein